MLTSHCRSHARGEYERGKNLQTKENPEPVETLNDSGVDKPSTDPDKQSLDPEDSHSEESYPFAEQSLCSNEEC